MSYTTFATKNNTATDIAISHLTNEIQDLVKDYDVLMHIEHVTESAPRFLLLSNVITSTATYKFSNKNREFVDPNAFIVATLSEKIGKVTFDYTIGDSVPLEVRNGLPAFYDFATVNLFEITRKQEAAV